MNNLRDDASVTNTQFRSEIIRKIIRYAIEILNACYDDITSQAINEGSDHEGPTIKM
jgi:hypothetical protein